jgi:hypothetical protein
VKPRKVTVESARAPAWLTEVTDAISAPAFAMSAVDCAVVWRTIPAVRVPFSVVAVGEAEVRLDLAQTVSEAGLVWRAQVLDDVEDVGEICMSETL